MNSAAGTTNLFKQVTNYASERVQTRFAYQQMSSFIDWGLARSAHPEYGNVLQIGGEAVLLLELFAHGRD